MIDWQTVWKEVVRRFRRKPKRVGLICIRLDEMFRVHPEQIILNCSKCGEQVGVYPSGQGVLAEYGDRVDIICNHCQPPGIAAGLAPGAHAESSQSKWRWE